MILGYVGNLSCAPGQHVHLEVKSDSGNYACWADVGRPGTTVSDSAKIGGLGRTSATSAREVCRQGNDLQQYVGRIVQWNGDTKAQRTSWVVSGEYKRYWVPDGGTYNCLRGTGYSDAGALSSSVLDRLPDQNGQAITCSGDRLSPNRVMLRNTYIRSTDDRYVLWLQNDGNLVMYGPSGAVWANHQTSDLLIMQSDGNLVTYAYGRGATWWSGTNGTGATTLVVQNDGNLVLYSPSRAVWTYNRGRI